MNAVESFELLFNVLVNVILCFAVLKKAEFLKKKKGNVELVGPFSWFLITLVTGVFGAALFWFCNFDELRNH